MRIGRDLEIEWIAISVEEGKVPNVGRSFQIGLNVGLDDRQPFRQLNVEALLAGILVDQQPGATVAEGDLGKINSVSKQVKIRFG
jgi:hypothetical protein